jgi:hypothetical protein
MTDIETKALVLLNKVRRERGGNSYTEYTRLRRDHDDGHEALCRAIEQHEAFKQEVSDVVEDYHEACWPEIYFGFDHFIIPKPKPDPLVEAYHDALPETAAIHGKKTVLHICGLINAALEARGLEIREKK